MEANVDGKIKYLHYRATEAVLVIIIIITIRDGAAVCTCDDK